MWNHVTWRLKSGALGNGTQGRRKYVMRRSRTSDINVRGSNVDMRDRKKTLLSAYCMLTLCWKFHSASHLILMSILWEGPHFHLISESRDIRCLYQGHVACVTGLVPKPAWVLFCLLGSVEQTQKHQVELGYFETIKERRKTQKLLFNR